MVFRVPRDPNHSRVRTHKNLWLITCPRRGQTLSPFFCLCSFRVGPTLVPQAPSSTVRNVAHKGITANARNPWVTNPAEQRRPFCSACKKPQGCPAPLAYQRDAREVFLRKEPWFLKNCTASAVNSQ